MYKRQVYRPVEYMAVSDAFSTESETVLTQQQVALEEVADVFTQQVEAVTTDVYKRQHLFRGRDDVRDAFGKAAV